MKTKTNAVRFSIEDYFRNFVFSEGNKVWVGYRLNRVYYPLNDKEFFSEYIDNGKGIFEHDEYEYHFMNIPKGFEIRNHIQQTNDNLVQGELAEVGKYYFNELGDMLENEIQVSDYTTYLFVCLTKRKEFVNPNEFFQLLKEQIAKTIREMTSTNDSTDVLLEMYLFREKELFLDLRNYKSLARVTEEDIERILYYMFHRGNVQIPKRKLNRLELTEGIIQNRNGYLEIEQLEKTHYSSFISVTDMPGNMSGTAFIHDLQNSVSFPIESHERVTFSHKEKDKKTVRRKRKLIFEQENDYDTTNALLDDDDVILFGEERLNQLNNELKSETQRLCNLSITLVVSALSLEELERRVRTIEYVLETTDFIIYRSKVDNLTLFNQCLIGSKRRFNVFNQFVTTGYVADLGMDLSKKIGNVFGLPVGRVITSKNYHDVIEAVESSSQVVWYSPHLTKLAIDGAKHTNGNTLITGPPGSGKSVLVKFLFIWLTFLGQKILYVDPKNETELFFHKALEKFSDIPMFKKLIESVAFISISEDEKYRGVLDPMIFLPEEQGKQTALNVLQTLGEINKDSSTVSSKKTTIIKAINEVYQSNQPNNLTRVIREIEKTDTDLAVLLSNYNDGVGKVLLGNDESKAISFKNQINVLGLQGLKLPNEKEILGKDLNSEQIASMAIWTTIMKLTYVFSEDKEEDAVIIYDEAGAMENTTQGAYAIDDSLRKGRANGTDIALVTQAFLDYDKEDKKELISHKFAFKPKAKEAREKILGFFEMDVNKANMDLLNNLKAGTCLFQDHMGRNQPIAIDVMFEEMLSAVSSTNKDREQTQRALAMEITEGV